MDPKVKQGVQLAVLTGAVGTVLFGASVARAGSYDYCCGRDDCWELESALVACDPNENECNSSYPDCCATGVSGVCS